MIKPLMLGLAIALAAAAPAVAQRDTPTTNETPSTDQTEKQLIGTPVYSSDGEQLGQVVEVAMADGKLRAVRAELGQFLGLGTATAMISGEIVEQKTDRLEVAMTADEVRKVLTKKQ
jgi:uncharacterized protein YrrD